MASDLFGERRPQSLEIPGYDLARGSFEQMRVKVAFPITCGCKSLQNIDANLSCLST